MSCLLLSYLLCIMLYFTLLLILLSLNILFCLWILSVCYRLVCIIILAACYLTCLLFLSYSFTACCILACLLLHLVFYLLLYSHLSVTYLPYLLLSDITLGDKRRVTDRLCPRVYIPKVSPYRRSISYISKQLCLLFEWLQYVKPYEWNVSRASRGREIEPKTRIGLRRAESGEGVENVRF